MKFITLRSYVGADGLLQLQLPDELKDRNITIIIRTESSEWLSVLQKTAGSIPNLERPPQGEYEVRQSLIKKLES